MLYILNDQIWLGGLILEYSKNSIYIVGCAKVAAENPITVASQYLYSADHLDRDSGQIYDADINSVCDITERFVKSPLWSAEAFIPITMQLSKILVPGILGTLKRPLFSVSEISFIFSGAEHASAALWLIFYFS